MRAPHFADGLLELVEFIAGLTLRCDIDSATDAARGHFVEFRGKVRGFGALGKRAARTVKQFVADFFATVRNQQQAVFVERGRVMWW